MILGFAGVLIMLRPGRGEFSFAAVAVLIAAFCYACQAITARRLGGTESTLSLAFYVVVGPLIVAAVVFDSDMWLAPDIGGWMLTSGGRSSGGSFSSGGGFSGGGGSSGGGGASGSW